MDAATAVGPNTNWSIAPVRDWKEAQAVWVEQTQSYHLKSRSSLSLRSMQRFFLDRPETIHLKVKAVLYNIRIISKLHLSNVLIQLTYHPRYLHTVSHGYLKCNCTIYIFV